MLNYQRVIIQNLGKLGKEECCSVFFWEDFWNCSESVPFYGTAYFRHDFNTENWLENCGFTKHSCDLDPAVIEAMGVSTVAAKPVWSWARKDVKNIFIYFHVYRFKHALVKVMSCESQTGVWLMSFGAAQPPSLSFFGTQGSSWKSEADQVGPHHAPQFQDARFSCLNAALLLLACASLCIGIEKRSKFIVLQMVLQFAFFC